MANVVIRLCRAERRMVDEIAAFPTASGRGAPGARGVPFLIFFIHGVQDRSPAAGFKSGASQLLFKRFVAERSRYDGGVVECGETAFADRFFQRVVENGCSVFQLNTADIGIIVGCKHEPDLIGNVEIKFQRKRSVCPEQIVTACLIVFQHRFHPAVFVQNTEPVVHRSDSAEAPAETSGVFAPQVDFFPVQEKRIPPGSERSETEPFLCQNRAAFCVAEDQVVQIRLFRAPQVRFFYTEPECLLGFSRRNRLH